MNYKMIGRFAYKILLIEALFMLPAMVIGLIFAEWAALKAFLGAFSLILITSGVLMLLCSKADSNFNSREGMVCVGMSWIVMSLFGSLPFWLSGEIPNYIDAFFEIISGFTTTGCSILSDVECLSKSILYWRSFSHWLGGMGVLALLLALVPGGQGAGYTIHLLKAESPGPDVGKLVPKMRQSAAIPYVIYIVLTIVNLIFLLLGDMPLLDALCTAFGTAGTGGLGIYNDSMAGCTPYIQNVTTVFMFLFGINFTCYYLLLIKQVKSVFKDEELRLYLILVGASIVLIALNIRTSYGTLAETVRHAAFQVTSIISTTGYSSCDYDHWPAFSKAVLVILMMVGACAGSTSGGFKCSRLLLIVKSLKRRVNQLRNPHQVQAIRINGRVVDEKVIDTAHAFLIAYVLIIFLSFLVISLDNFSFGTNFTAVLSCINNIGPGLEQVGPTCNFGAYSALSKLVLIFDMLAGRLGLFPILALFSRSTWKR